MSHNPNGVDELKLFAVFMKNGSGISISWIIKFSASLVWSISKFGSTAKTILSTAEAISTGEVFKYPLTETPRSCKYFFKFRHIHGGVKVAFIILIEHFEPGTFRVFLTFRDFKQWKNYKVKGTWDSDSSGSQSRGPWSPGALKFLPWSPEPYHFTDWSPDSFLAVEPWAQTHFAWSPEPSIFKFDHSSSRLHWFLITAFLCFFVRVNGHKETESEEKTVHNTQGRSQSFCMEGFLMYIACPIDNRAPEAIFSRGVRGQFLNFGSSEVAFPWLWAQISNNLSA